MIRSSNNQLPRIYHRRLGEIVVTALSDGYLDVPYDVMRNIRDVFPGVTCVPIPGHTPGHTAYLVTSGGESLLLWGDTVHIPEVQFARPEVTMAFDSDPAAAAIMRRRVFDMASTERFLIGGTHLHFPGFAHLARWSGGYRLVPEPWALET